VCASVASALPSDGRDLDSESVADLRLLFAKDYAVDPDAPARLPSSGRIYAFAMCDSGSALRQYASRRFIVPEASEYAGLILADDAKAAEGTPDLTQDTLPQTAVLTPAGATAEGFTPYIAGRPFTKALLLPAGFPVEVRWKRPGFSPVNRIVTPAQGITTLEAPDTSLSRKTISASSFYITEQGSQKSIGSFMIKVNGVDIDEPQSFTFAELNDAKVEISSPGYFAFSGHLDLATSAQALVQMKQLHRTYRFDLPLNTPDPVEAIRIYLKTRKPITKCPIEGYEVAGNEILEGAGVCNNLVYVGGGSRRIIRYAAAACAAALLIGFFIGWLAFHSPAPAPKHRPQPAPVAAAPAQTEPVAQPVQEPVQEPEPEAATEPDYKEAVAYLDSHKAWARDEMEEIPALKGLYDDINNYNFHSILTYWAPRLNQSANFRSVTRAVAGASGKRSPKTGSRSPAYINSGKQSIQWRAYTYWVDP
ncbi:MAG: hypothetical protein K2L75_03715, partial [Muribaculaceae bacterium]|nr:hypothetical protein [Muribaculaceae bacterium]